MFDDLIYTVCFIIVKTVYVNFLKLFVWLLLLPHYSINSSLRNGYHRGTMIEVKISQRFC